ncbi:MAG TPA: type II toxin-antitoxin system RelE/ParE family toxin [Terriglobia bacterium]|nr:type II toxin-antitoxin system RelE/ParE family toxin [Terriglobia bacterium]
MADYKVHIKPAAGRELDAMPKRDRQRLVLRITELARNPRPYGSEKLSGEDGYRIRQGNYRVIYSVDDSEKAVRILKIAHRKDVYRRLG